MRISPAASEMTVLGRAPLRTFADGRPGSARFFSYPRCSVISSFRAVSSTFLVKSFSSPSGPVSSRPRARASATIAAAAACSGDSCRPSSSSLLSLWCGFTASDVITHSAHPAGSQPGVSGRKHRSLHSPGRDTDCRATARGSTTAPGCRRWHRGSRGPVAVVRAPRGAVVPNGGERPPLPCRRSGGVKLEAA